MLKLDIQGNVVWRIKILLAYLVGTINMVMVRSSKERITFLWKKSPKVLPPSQLGTNFRNGSSFYGWNWERPNRRSIITGVRLVGDGQCYVMIRLVAHTPTHTWSSVAGCEASMHNIQGHNPILSELRCCLLPPSSNLFTTSDATAVYH